MCVLQDGKLKIKGLEGKISFPTEKPPPPPPLLTKRERRAALLQMFRETGTEPAAPALRATLAQEDEAAAVKARKLEQQQQRRSASAAAKKAPKVAPGPKVAPAVDGPAKRVRVGSTAEQKQVLQSAFDESSACSKERAKGLEATCQMDVPKILR